MSLKPTRAANVGVTFAANEPDFRPPTSAGDVAVTLVTSTSPPVLTKTMRMRDGHLAKQAAAEMTRGKCELRAVPDAAAFAELVRSLDHNQALVYGRCKRGDVPLYSRKQFARLAPHKQQEASTRTKDAFEFAGPGILMLDYDPRPGHPPLDATALRAAIASVLPALATCASVQWVSSSSCIFDSDGNEVAGVRGQRIYILVTDAHDIPRAGAVLADRLWLAGYGHVEVSKSGASLIRCLVDTSVWEENRLDFASGAICEDGLAQRRGEPDVHDGHLLDTATALPDLAEAELIRLRKLKASALDDAQPAAKAARKTWADTRAEAEVGRLPNASSLTAEERHVALNAAHARALRAVDGQTLDGDFVLTVVSDGGNRADVTVADILADRTKYHGCRTLDPLEPDYGDWRAVGYLALEGRRPVLFSHAHGGTAYRLVRGLRHIVHAAGHTRATTDETLGFLRESGEMYDRGSEMVFADDHGLHLAKGPALAFALARSIQYVKHVFRGRGKDRAMAVEDIDPPLEVVRQVEALRGYRNLQRIRAAVNAPLMLRDSRLLQEPGHDARSELYVSEDCAQVQLPERVSEAMAMAALENLWHPFREFKVASKLDRGVLLAAIMTAIERPAVALAPAFGLDAPAQGSGKTYLAQCLGALASGEVPAAAPPVTDEQEIRKRLLATASEAPAVILWDNLVGMLHSPSLAAFLTSGTIKDRVLGESREASAETRSLFLLTGNNLELAGDLPRRVLVCRLDTGRENPTEEPYSGNPRGYILAHRAELVQAGLVLLRGFRQSGWTTGTTTASFEDWDSLVRQCVAWVATMTDERFDDPAKGLKAGIANDPEREELGELLQGLVEALDSPGLEVNKAGGFTAAAVHKAVADHPGLKLRGVLTDMCARGLSAKSIGRVLAHHKDRPIGSRRLKARSQKGGHPTLFWVDTGEKCGL